MNIETKCLHAGYEPENGEPRQLPIYQSTTWKYASSDDMGKLFDLEASGYFYTRLQNPTNDMVAAKLAALEGGVAAMLTSSGQAANFFALFNICESGSHIVASSAIYGGTYNLLGVTMKKMGIDVTFVDQDLPEEELAKAFRPNTRAMFGETVTNPTVSVLDIEKFARLAHSHGVPLIVDNTFATPVNCRPIEFGADIVTHSTTKYMDGHAISVGGAIIDSGNFDWMAHADKYPGMTTPDESYHGLVYAEKFGKLGYITKATSQLMRDLGSIQSPQNAFYLNNGRERAQNRPLPRGTREGRVDQLSRPRGRQVSRPSTEIFAQRLLRRHGVRGQGRQRQRDPLHGRFEARDHRHPRRRREDLPAASRQPHPPPALRAAAP